MLTHLAKLQNIPKEIYEAASIDGATWWSKFTRIEIPLIMSSIYLMLVFVIIGTIKDAGMIIALTGGMDGGPGGRATVPALFMLRKAFVNQEMGAACAVGIILTVVIMALQKLSSLGTGRESERHVDEEDASVRSDRGERLAALSTWLARYRRLPSYDGLPVRCSP